MRTGMSVCGRGRGPEHTGFKGSRAPTGQLTSVPQLEAEARAACAACT